LAARFVSVSQMPSKRSSRLFKILSGALAEADEVIQLEGRLERFAHFWALVVRQFIRHRCLVRASALSYSTLLALIPLLVVALNVTSTLLSPQNEAKLTHFVEHSVASLAPAANIPQKTNTNEANEIEPPANSPQPVTNYVATAADTNAVAILISSNQPVVIPAATLNTQNEVARTIHELVQKASSGTLGIFGVVLLIFTSISLLRGIEDTFNDIWGVTRPRNWFVQFTLYWMIISLGPLLLSAALGVTGTAHMSETRSFMEASPFLSPIVKHLLPITLLSVFLGLFYWFTPNTEVQLKAAMIGGACAGVSWHVYNQLGFVLAARAMGASKFYGGVFLIVLLMGGVYILWLILLFGTQIAYAFQNRSAYLQERLAENVNHRGREFVALRIMTCLGRRFQIGQCPATVSEISHELAVPSRLTQTVLRVLTTTRLVTEVGGAEAAFMPARPLDAISAHDILIAMRTGTGQELPIADAAGMAEIYGEFARIEQAERDAAAGVTVLALSNRMNQHRELPKTVEPEKTLPGTTTMETASVAPPVETPQPPTFPEKVEPAKPEVEQSKPPMEPPAESPRREPARPDENSDFPL